MKSLGRVPTPRSQVALDLQAAREVLRRRGLAKSTFEDETGRVCAVGAIQAVVNGDPCTVNPLSERREEALDAVAATLTESRWGSWGAVAWFNNSCETTQADVEASFDAATSLALSEAAVES